LGQGDAGQMLSDGLLAATRLMMLFILQLTGIALTLSFR
jgi:hypothetical protein